MKNLHDWTSEAAVIGSAARALLRQFMHEEMRPLRLRLMGVRVSPYKRCVKVMEGGKTRKKKKK